MILSFINEICSLSGQKSNVWVFFHFIYFLQRNSIQNIGESILKCEALHPGLFDLVMNVIEVFFCWGGITNTDMPMSLSMWSKFVPNGSILSVPTHQSDNFSLKFPLIFFFRQKEIWYFYCRYLVTQLMIDLYMAFHVNFFRLTLLKSTLCATSSVPLLTQCV